MILGPLSLSRSMNCVCARTSLKIIHRGAVLSKLPHQAIITSVVATRHYGVEMHCDNENDADKARPQIWCNFEKKNKVLKVSLTKSSR